MNKDMLKQFILAMKMGQVNVNKTKGWVQVKCPLAEWTHDSGRDRNPSFGLYVHPAKVSKASCFSCGFHGELHDLVIEIRHRSKKDKKYDYKKAMQLIAQEEEGGGLAFAYEDEDEREKGKIYKFSDEWLRSFRPAIKSERATAYAQKRGTPLWIIKELGLRYDSSEREKRLCFPVRDFSGTLVGLHGRTVSKKIVPPYRMYTDIYPRKGGKNNPIVWYGEDRVDFDKPVVIVESVFDYMRVYEFYKNVICPLTAAIEKDKIERLGDMVRAVLLFDGDTPGRKAAMKMRQYLPKVKFKIEYLPEGEDPSSMGKQQIIKILKKHLKSNLLTLDA